MKKLLILAISFVLVLTANSNAFAAQNATGGATPKQASALESLQSRATKEIDRRVTALTHLIEIINARVRLSTTEKTALVKQIQAQIDSLNTLKTGVAADTDLESLKVDVKSITDSYRIFALYIPKIRILSAAGVMTDITTSLNDVATELGSRIETAKTNGADVTDLEESLADMKDQIEIAQTNYQKAQTNVNSLTPEGYPGNKTTLQQARESIRKAHEALLKAKEDAKTIAQGLKVVVKTNTASPAAKPR